MTITETTPSVYVGTYHKYNNGSIQGAWIELTDKDTFYNEIKELHKDESDPEYMFQDFEGFPKSLYSECSIDEKLWEFLELSEDDREIVAAYSENFVNFDFDFDDAMDAYCGTWESFQEYSDDYVESTGMLNEIHKSIKMYFDYESFARDLEMDYFVSKTSAGQVMVFHNY